MTKTPTSAMRSNRSILRAFQAFVLASFAVFSSSAARAQWVTAPVSAPGVQYLTFHSAAAGATVSFHAYVPPQYEANPTARFPVLYWLHGSGDGTFGIPSLANFFGTAMAQGRIPPMLVVFPNGMQYSMWCDSKNGTVPMESVVLDDLIPHIDATFRTIARRSGRIVDGFSMGGQGAGRLGFRRPDLFCGVSMLGAGPIQLDFLTAPDNSTTPPALRKQIYAQVWGSDPAYFLAQHPWTIVADRASAVLAAQTHVRMALGDLDSLLPMNQQFDAHLGKLGIPHSFTVIPGLGHSPQLVLNALGQANWDFYNASLAAHCPLAADIDCSGEVDAIDLARILNEWGEGHGPEDVDGDGTVGGGDLAAVLNAWGTVG